MKKVKIKVVVYLDGVKIGKKEQKVAREHLEAFIESPTTPAMNDPTEPQIDEEALKRAVQIAVNPSLGGFRTGLDDAE